MVTYLKRKVDDTEEKAQKMSATNESQAGTRGRKFSVNLVLAVNPDACSTARTATSDRGWGVPGADKQFCNRFHPLSRWRKLCGIAQITVNRLSSVEMPAKPLQKPSRQTAILQSWTRLQHKNMGLLTATLTAFAQATISIHLQPPLKGREVEAIGQTS
jgi:hypothetical protein